MSEPATPPAPPSWIADLPEDLRSNPSLTTFKGDDWKTVGPMISKSFVESRALIGKREDDLFPKDDWKPEQHAAWNKRIGVPDAPDKYPEIDKALVEKAGVPKEVLDGAMKRFHELGLTPKQAKGLLHEWYLPNAITGSEIQAKQVEATRKATIETLQMEYGDKLDAKKGLVKSVLQLGGSELAEAIESSGYGDDPRMFRALAILGEKFLEDRSGKGGTAELGPEASAAAAQRRIEQIKAARIADSTMEVKYSDPRSAEYMEWKELFKKAYPQQGAA